MGQGWVSIPCQPVLAGEPTGASCTGAWGFLAARLSGERTLSRESVTARSDEKVDGQRGTGQAGGRGPRELLQAAESSCIASGLAGLCVPPLAPGPFGVQRPQTQSEGTACHRAIIRHVCGPGVRRVKKGPALQGE